MHESSDAKMAPMMRVAGRPLRTTEILGLVIFILMAVVMFVVGASLFWSWLAEPGSAPVGTPADTGPISGGFTVPAVPLVIGVQMVGALALVVVYMVSSAGRRV